MMSGDPLGLKFPDISLMGEEKHQKNLTQETCLDRESNPDPLRVRRIRHPLLHNVILYGCETWTLILREEKKLRVFKCKVLRKMFGPKRDEETGEWRRLHNTELKDLYEEPDIIRKIKSHRLRWAGHVARMGDERGVRRILEGKPEGKRPVVRPRM
ncbi:hypothetical protein C0J52_28056, partial [Blattella germanica]